MCIFSGHTERKSVFVSYLFVRVVICIESKMQLFLASVFLRFNFSVFSDGVEAKDVTGAACDLMVDSVVDFEEHFFLEGCFIVPYTALICGSNGGMLTVQVQNLEFLRNCEMVIVPPNILRHCRGGAHLNGGSSLYTCFKHLVSHAALSPISPPCMESAENDLAHEGPQNIP
tara:strand:- start:806 stop:1321 length:516 start_codon:yes stop_codon:yes gene_type:complete